MNPSPRITTTAINTVTEITTIPPKIPTRIEINEVCESVAGGGMTSAVVAAVSLSDTDSVRDAVIESGNDGTVAVFVADFTTHR